MRQFAFRRISDNTKGHEGQIVFRSHARCNVGFHIDRDSACADMQRTFRRRTNDGGVDAREIDDGGAIDSQR